MLFNSLAFVAFLPVVFLLYWFVFNKTIKLQNFFVLAASYFFYGSWDWRFLTLIFISSLTDFILGQKIYYASSTYRKKTFLTISIVINLGILGFFKYYHFFVDSFIALFEMFGVLLEPSTLNVLLPVGISFYTFQTLSYTIDIYRGKLKPTDNAIAFFAFVAFFPQLVAGPIERAIDLLPQFMHKRKFNSAQATSGCRQILWGLFKKVVIADSIAKYVAIIYSTPESFLWYFCNYSDYTIHLSSILRFFWLFRHRYWCCQTFQL